MLEWLKRHAWKACKPLKGFGSSNLPLSARKEARSQKRLGFSVYIKRWELALISADIYWKAQDAEGIRASLRLQGPLRQGGGEKTCSGKANLPTARASLRLQGPLRQGGGEKTCDSKANLPTAREPPVSSSPNENLFENAKVQTYFQNRQNYSSDIELLICPRGEITPSFRVFGTKIYNRYEKTNETNWGGKRGGRPQAHQWKPQGHNQAHSSSGAKGKGQAAKFRSRYLHKRIPHQSNTEPMTQGKKKGGRLKLLMWTSEIFLVTLFLILCVLLHCPL